MEVRLRRLGPIPKINVLKVPRECRTKIWLAGRGTSCQIYTKSKFASRQHFCITYKEQKFFISDLQSANGTFVNDEKLDCERLLTFGSQISVGVPLEMWESAECIVYVFEPYSGNAPVNDQMSLLPKKKVSLSKTERFLAIATLKTESARESALRTGNGEAVDMKPRPKDIDSDEEKTFVNDSPSSDVIVIESSTEAENDEPKPAKIRKIDMGSPTIPMDCESSQSKPKMSPKEESRVAQGEHCVADDMDMAAYEALTQVDEPQVKSEPELMNYSLTEELIEISDSEDDWSPNPALKVERSSSPEGGDEDEDVVFLETIVKSRGSCGFDAPPPACKAEDDLTEIDKKWMGRLLKIKDEKDLFSQNEEMARRGDELREQPEEDTKAFPDEVEARSGKTTGSRGKSEDSVASCAARLSKLSTKEAEDSRPASSTKAVPKGVMKKVAPRKSVSFDMVPQIRYFKVPLRPKLTPSEKGRLRFTRIIFNICNWNTHWLEECKRVAPDKDPPDLCEERLRRIPKKFPSHSDYMAAFIPVMLLDLWNKVKERWVNSGESGFRQTVSCDSYEDYCTENLCVYRCTGLVQNLDAHKELLREGQLVLLRLHQSQHPSLATPAAEKYSKKLGYLVFGFVESKTYERFHKQSLHEALAERCGSVMGDLHVVRLSVLVKKRPSFEVDKRKLIQLTASVVQRISQEIRTFRGICFLADSSLCGLILRPTKIEPSLVEPPKEEQIVFKVENGPLDDVQRDIVRKLSYACFSTNSFLYSIYGAAGTGKGQLIAALILQLLYGDDWKTQRPKIIYCTQRSVPLDEMVLKLKTCSQAADEPFTVVRVGPMKEVKPEVKDVCLSNLASLRTVDKRASDRRRFDAEVELLRDAEVICTTCISAGISKMCSAFAKLATRHRARKVICVIDEAMSSPEKDSVIPLLLGVTHLILVGDIYQMEPSLSSEKMHSLGLDMPLFWRIYKNFTPLPKESWPVCILKTQYRMNSALSKCASPLIYNTMLPKPVATASNHIPNLRTHLLLVDEAPESVTKAERESREARTVSQVVRAVMRTAKAAAGNGLRVAVIVCEGRQVESVRGLLPKREFAGVEIDQVQAFQGREFEVVVFVYDGRKVLTSWLATALTRARCSLFVCASRQSVAGQSLIARMAKSAEKYNFLKPVRPDMTLEELEQIITM